MNNWRYRKYFKKHFNLKNLSNISLIWIFFIWLNAKRNIAIYKFIFSQEHSYEKHNNKTEKEETIEESKNAINNQLHQPAAESSEIKLDAAEADENTTDLPSPEENKAIVNFPVEDLSLLVLTGAGNGRSIN